MNKKNNLLCCDWGTSNFRLYLVNSLHQKIIGQLEEGQGVAVVFKAWKKQKVQDRVSFFRQFLQQKINQLAERLGVVLTNIPVILSGMASSSIGIVEIPYSSLPFHLNQPKLNFQKITATIKYPNPLFVFGGLKAAIDVMRGEEVQLLGLKEKLPEGDCICILPGTHSKHIWVEKGTATRFQTFITGELFRLLEIHSILSNSVAGTFDLKNHLSAFKEGVTESKSGNLLNLLSKIRANSLLKGVSAPDNQAYLSGLLIGAELKTLRLEKYSIVLSGGKPLIFLYEKALATLFPNQKIVAIPADELAMAIPKAHSYLFQSIN
ncbi:MAG: 2-dehydro-3-deoxygalactonokinase [Bacteroidota bacterium]